MGSRLPQFRELDLRLCGLAHLRGVGPGEDAAAHRRGDRTADDAVEPMVVVRLGAHLPLVHLTSAEVVGALSDRGDALSARTFTQKRSDDSYAHFASLHVTAAPSDTLCAPPTITVSPALRPDFTNTRSGSLALSSTARRVALPSSTT